VGLHADPGFMDDRPSLTGSVECGSKRSFEVIQHAHRVDASEGCLSVHSTSLLCSGGRPVYVAFEPSATSLCVATSRPLCFSGGCLSTGLEPVEEFYPPTSFATTSNFQKVRSDKATTLLVATDWPGQPWYAQIHLMLTGRPYLRPEEKSLLSLPFDQFKFSPSSKYLTSGEI